MLVQQHTMRGSWHVLTGNQRVGRALRAACLDRNQRALALAPGGAEACPGGPSLGYSFFGRADDLRDLSLQYDIEIQGRQEPLPMSDKFSLTRAQLKRIEPLKRRKYEPCGNRDS